MARTPPEHVAARWEIYIDELRSGTLPMRASRKAHIPHKALIHRRLTDPDFVIEETSALAEYAEIIEQVILDAAVAKEFWVETEGGKGGHWESNGPSKDAVNAAEKWLKARARLIWNPSPTLDINHNVKVSLEGSDDIARLTAALEERQALADRMWAPAAILESADRQADIVEAELVENE